MVWNMSLLPLQVGFPGGIELIIFLFILFISFIIPLIISFLIYRDAKTRGSQHALAWGVGSFFGAIVVWILYFIVRDEVGTK
jgi:threonine/homoserine/homoserine lactone efflux protein